MAVSSFGQRFTISPLQLVLAYSTIANGGSDETNISKANKRQ